MENKTVGQHQMNALCRWLAKISLAGVQSEDSWLVRVVKCPLHRVWLCLDMSRQESTSWHGFAICHPVMDVSPGLLLGSCAVTAISPPREMFEHLSPTPELFASNKNGSNYQTELLECHSIKTLEGLELVNLSHTFYTPAPQHLQSWRRKNFILPKAVKLSWKATGIQDMAQAGTHWGEERGKEACREPGDCSGRQSLLMNTTRMSPNFSFVWAQGKVPLGNLQPLLLRSNGDEIHDQ